MKKIAPLLIILLYSSKMFAQSIPSEITFHTTKIKSTFGTESTENSAVATCITFRKVNNNVTGLNCNTYESNVVFMISGVQDEKKNADTYNITFNGFHYYPAPVGPVKSFLTYGYSYGVHKWYVFVEDVLDNDKDGVSRVVFEYYDINN